VVASVPALKVPAPELVKPVAKPVVPPAEKPAEKPVPKVTESVKPPAVAEAKAVDPKPAAAAGRFVVQIGAFADVLKAREARVKLEKAGLKTYTQVVQAKEGRRIRVRVGPFETKAETEKVAEKIKKLDLPAAILEL
jgi:DedD protein